MTTEAAIRELERRIRAAMLASDVEELEALLADELVFTDHLGGLWRKRDDLDAHRAGRLHVESLEASDERILLLDGAAVVSVQLRIAGTFAGEPASGTFRFTRVWAPTAPGRWQVVAAHSTMVAAHASAAAEGPRSDDARGDG